MDVLSLSSGVGTSSQSGSAASAGASTPTESQTRSLILPGMHVVCLENHSSGEPGTLHISQGDIIEGRTKKVLPFGGIQVSKIYCDMVQLSLCLVRHACCLSEESLVQQARDVVLLEGGHY